MQHQPLDARVLVEGARHLGVGLSTRQIAQFCLYYEELLDWNRRVNLTSITEWCQVQRLHFLDSLTVMAALPDGVRAHGAVVDVGSGAGFPGLPLKIACPGVRLVLVESVGKKARFLEHLATALGIPEVTVCVERAETLAHRQEHRAVYDVALARALYKLSATLEVTLPFCHVGGLAVIQKKGDVANEVDISQRAMRVLGGALREMLPVHVPGLEDGRVLVVAEKTASTPEAYPRRPGMPAKRPL